MIYIVLFVLSVTLTYGVKYLAHKKSIMDIPNERSSHSTPTPRGGGIAILIVFYIGLFYFTNINKGKKINGGIKNGTRS